MLIAGICFRDDLRQAHFVSRFHEYFYFNLNFLCNLENNQSQYSLMLIFINIINIFRFNQDLVGTCSSSETGFHPSLKSSAEYHEQQRTKHLWSIRTWYHWFQDPSTRRYHRFHYPWWKVLGESRKSWKVLESLLFCYHLGISVSVWVLPALILSEFGFWSVKVFWGW